MAKKRNMSKRWVAKKHGFRSGTEMEVSQNLKDRKIKFEYETLKIEYEVPPRKAKYTPDFILDNGIILEVKGRFFAADRKKMLLVKMQNPKLDIRFLFTNSKMKITKSSKTTYGDWCDKNGFQYADTTVPNSWVR